MIAHIFNSSIVAGPETLVLPSLTRLGEPVCAIFLSELRKGEASRGPIEFARNQGVESHEIKVRSRLDPKAIRELTELLRKLNVKIAHAHDVKASTYTWLAARKLPVTKISTHHGVRGRSGFVARVYENFYSRIVLPRFDRVLTVCSSDREILLRRGLCANKTLVHLNGVDRKRTDIRERVLHARSIRQSWGLPEPTGNTVWIGVVGRIAPEKRHDRILETLAHLSAHQPDLDWRMVCFGSGPLEVSLKDHCRQLGIADRVHWMGYRNGVGHELAGMDILLSLSDAEGLPINLIEAGWAATPVVAKAADGNLDLIGSSREGLLLNPELSIAEISLRLGSLIRNHAERRNMGEAFQRRVEEKFSGSAWLETLRQIYFQADSHHGIRIA